MPAPLTLRPARRCWRKSKTAAAPRKASEVEKLRRENRELREWKRRLSLLLDYGKKLSARKELDGLLHLLVDVARNVLQADRCTVFLLDKQGGELWSRIASGAPEIRVPSHKGIVGETVTHDRVVNIHDAYKDPRFNPEVDRATSTSPGRPWARTCRAKSSSAG